PVPDGPKKKPSTGPNKPVPSGPKPPASDAPKKAVSSIQIGSSGEAYKPKYKGRPKPVDPRVVKRRMIGLGVVIALALAFIGFQFFGSKKEPEANQGAQSTVPNPNIAPATAIRKVPSKPTYRPTAGSGGPRTGIPGATPGAEERPRQEEQPEGIH